MCGKGVSVTNSRRRQHKRNVGTARSRFPLTVWGYFFTLNVGGLAGAGPCPTSTLIRSYPGEPGHLLTQHATLRLPPARRPRNHLTSSSDQGVL